MTAQHNLYQRKDIPRAGQDNRADWPQWDLYAEPQNAGPNPYSDVHYLPVVVETSLTPVVYGGGRIEWQDASGQVLNTDDAEEQGLLTIRETS